MSIDVTNEKQINERKTSLPRQQIRKCLLFVWVLTFIVFCFVCKMSSLKNRLSAPAEQLWKIWDRKARKQGFHSTIYSSDGSQYKGEWKNDKKHG